MRKAGRRPALPLKLIGLRFPGASRFMGNCFCAGIMRLRLCLSGRKARLFRAVAVDFGIELDGTAQIQAWKAPPEVRRIPSWDAVPGADGRHPPDVVQDTRAAAALEQMIALPEGRREDARRLLQSLYTSEADLVPDLAAGTLTVRVVHPANPLLARALEPLCTELTQTQTEFPTTPLRMVFTLVSSEPGATQNPRDRGS